MTYLTSKNIVHLEGSLIKWSAPTTSGNYGYWRLGFAGGFAAVTGAALRTIAGDKIEDAKGKQNVDDEMLYYGDKESCISYEVLPCDDIERLILDRQQAEWQAAEIATSNKKKAFEVIKSFDKKIHTKYLQK